ncbi:MAG: hypothetical protein CM15mP120_11960 [Pseudomonadota bacterium]|nr:MAG: hypothetical protein CM15mP120_11960 [Pseudomonadota bacterium]
MLSVPAVWADSGYAEADVIAVSPRYETVTYSEPREECRLERVAYSDRGHKSSTPKIVGALIGGALGNAVGAKRPNKQVGAVVGGLLGYSIGRTSRGIIIVTETRCATVKRKFVRFFMTAVKSNNSAVTT